MGVKMLHIYEYLYFKKRNEFEIIHVYLPIISFVICERSKL